ncbi:MAG: CIA30 family protein [Bacteroidota bacterium]
MKIYLTWVFSILLMIPTLPDTAFQLDFGQKKAGQTWRALNDGVMGGLSEGKVNLDQDLIRFQGQVSLENNGGFASFRSPFSRFDLSGAQTVEIRLRAPKGRFALVMETERVWFRPYYKHAIELAGTEWETVQIPLTAFHAYQVGRKLSQTLATDVLDDIIRIGIVTDFKQAAEFEVEIDYIRFNS